MKLLRAGGRGKELSNIWDMLVSGEFLATFVIGSHIKQIKVVCKECNVVIEEKDGFVAFLKG